MMLVPGNLQTASGKFFLILLLIITVLASLVALIAPEIAPIATQSWQVGQVASQEVLAPKDITYESQVSTQQQREAAARAVQPVYTPVDTGIARRQLERLHAALAYITSVRADAFADTEQKLKDLAALEDLHLSQEAAVSILALNEARWQAIQQEAIVVLEQVMRNPIREDRLDEARRSIPSLVSLSLPEAQAALVAELVSAFVAPNSFYSESLTEAARQKARESVQPVTRSLRAGETVIQRGQIITEADLEALQKLGLIQSRYNWQHLISAGALVVVVMASAALYLRHNIRLLQQPRGLTLIVALFLAFLLAARLTIPASQVIAFIFPLAAYSLTIVALFGVEFALVSTLLLSVLVSFGLPDALLLILYYLLSSVLGMLALGRAQRVLVFFWAGAIIAGSGILVALAYYLPQPDIRWIGPTALVGAALLNGAASASLAMLLQFFLAQSLGTITALQLIEISRPDHPLLQYVLRNAPGTYQHSLQVANLAEQAAERIGADALLTRVGALYHDIGKALNPSFFIENQLPGVPNPHEQLDPASSADIIIRHVMDGVNLARRYRLPRRIQDFILEHHGTLIARYQYVNAVNAAGGDESKVDIERFRYPGPRPGSRETAILMLADGSEARVRAERPKDEAEMRELIKTVIQNRVSLGQLDNTDLTLRDLDVILDSFVATLRGIYHPRIEYPQLEKAPETRLESSPTLPIAARSKVETSSGRASDPVSDET